MEPPGGGGGRGRGGGGGGADGGGGGASGRRGAGAGGAGERAGARWAGCSRARARSIQGWGAALYAREAVFRTTLDACAAALRGALAVPLLDVLYGREGARLSETAYAQPALLAVEYGLAAQWRAWGVAPAVVLGHSVGEVAAVCAAGGLSVAAAVQLAAARGRLMQAHGGTGGMVAVLAPVGAVTATAAATGGDGGGGERAVGGGGGRPGGGVHGVEGAAAAQGWGVQRLAVAHAFHTAAMEPMLGPWGAVAAATRVAALTVPVVSTVTGRWSTRRSWGRRAYWQRQVREPVQFAAALETLVGLGCGAVVEVGPQPTLIGQGRRWLGARVPVWGGSLERGVPDGVALGTTLGGAVDDGGAGGVGGGARGRRADARGPAHLSLPTVALLDRPTAGPCGERRREAHVSTRGRSLRRRGARPLAFVARAARSRVPERHQSGQQLIRDRPPDLRHSRLSNDRLHRSCAVCRGGGGRTDRTRSLRLRAGDATDRRRAPVAADHRGAVAARAGVRPDRERAGRWWRRPLVEPACLIYLAPHCDGAPDPATLDIASIQRRCGRELSGEEYYTRLREDGLEYGPAFRGIEHVWCGSDEAIVRLTTTTERTGAAVDPARLDTCAQAIYAALSPTATGALLVPVALGRVVQYGSLTEAFVSHAVLASGTHPSGNRVTATITVADASGRVLVQLSDLTLQRTPRSTFTRNETPGAPDLYYAVTWTRLTSDLDLARELPTVRRDCGLEIYDALEPRLHALSTDYVVTALLRLGWMPVPGDHVTVDTLADTLGVRPQHRRMFGRMLAMLAEDGVLRADLEGWRVVRALAPAGRETAPGLLQAFPDCRAELTMVARCGAELAEVLSGVRDPLELLFPGGSTEDLEALYRSAPYTRATNALVVRAVAAALATRPAEGRLRVLEIGAGTGGTASSVLPVMPADRTEYLYSDVSPLFTSRARQRFAGYPFVAYRTLDIERDPAPQGFEAASVDLILATNVLHATADLRCTMAFARDLLAPGGTLIMVETVAPQRWVDVIFGLTDGWWRFADADLRPDYPTLTVTRWRNVLGDLGFDRTAIVPADETGDALFHQAVIVTRRPEALEDGAATRPHWLVCADEMGVGAELAAHVRARGDCCTVVRRSGAALSAGDLAVAFGSAHDWNRALCDAAPAADAPLRVVYGWGIDASSAVDLPLDALRASESDLVGGALHLVQALLGHERWRAATLSLITRGAQPVADTPVTTPPAAALWGLGRGIAVEHPELRCRRLDLDPAEVLDASALLSMLDGQAAEDEVGRRHGEWHVARLTRQRPPAADSDRDPVDVAHRLGLAAVGGIDTLALRPTSRRAPGPGEVEVAVHAAGLNFRRMFFAPRKSYRGARLGSSRRDVSCASGQTPAVCRWGMRSSPCPPIASARMSQRPRITWSLSRRR